MFQETKKPTNSTQCFRSFRGGRNRDRIQSPSLGAAGGMLIAWKSDLFKLEVVEDGSYSTIGFFFCFFVWDIVHLWPCLKLWKGGFFSGLE